MMAHFNSLSLFPAKDPTPFVEALDSILRLRLHDESLAAALENSLESADLPADVRQMAEETLLLVRYWLRQAHQRRAVCAAGAASREQG